MGISCGGVCVANFVDGSAVTLTAAVTPGSIFAGWGGDCAASGTNPQCLLTMSQARTVSAIFNVQANPIFANGFEGN